MSFLCLLLGNKSSFYTDFIYLHPTQETLSDTIEGQKNISAFTFNMKSFHFAASLLESKGTFSLPKHTINTDEKLFWK